MITVEQPLPSYPVRVQHSPHNLTLESSYRQNTHPTVNTAEMPLTRQPATRMRVHKRSAQEFDRFVPVGSCLAGVTTLGHADVVVVEAVEVVVVVAPCT